MGESVKGLIMNGFFKQGENHVHRIAVFGPRGNIIGIISQSDIIRWLYRHLDQLEKFNSITLRQLGLEKSEVKCVNVNSTAINAFKKISKEKGN